MNIIALYYDGLIRDYYADGADVVDDEDRSLLHCYCCIIFIGPIE